MSDVRVIQLHEPTADDRREILERCIPDRIEQTYAVLSNRGCDRRLIRHEWIQYWLERGKTPLEVADIALGRPRSDAHLGGT